MSMSPEDHLCLFILFSNLTLPMMTHPLLPTQLLHRLLSMSPYSMSNVHLRRFSPTPLEQHCARRTDTHELDAFCAQDALICRAMGRLLQKGRYLLHQRVIMPLQQDWLSLWISKRPTSFLL